MRHDLSPEPTVSSRPMEMVDLLQVFRQVEPQGELGVADVAEVVVLIHVVVMLGWNRLKHQKENERGHEFE